MNYGNAKVAAGGTLVFTGMTMGEQALIITSAIILVAALAIGLRTNWRKNKKLSDK